MSDSNVPGFLYSCLALKGEQDFGMEVVGEGVAVVQRSAQQPRSEEVVGWIVLPVPAASPETCMSG